MNTTESIIAPCPRCGRYFEPPTTVEGEEGEPVQLAGHQPGGPLCIPIPKHVSRFRREVSAERPPLTEAEREHLAEEIRARLRTERGKAAQP